MYKRIDGNAPVLIIPGGFGSKLNVINPFTKQKTRAWFCQKFFPKLQQGEYAINYLWGEFDDNGRVRSFIEDFADLETERGNAGFDGCDRFYESYFLDLIKSNYLAYMSPIVNYLQKQHNYVLNDDLFCFTYDWRQSCMQVIDLLNDYIKQIFNKTKKKLVVITHSGGLNYLLAHFRKKPDYHEKIISLLTINAPIDGAGAFSIQTHINGYNLNMPFTQQAMRGAQTFCSGMFSYLPQNLNRYIKQNFICGSIFVKKLLQTKMCQNRIGAEFQQQYQQFENKQYKLNLAHYSKYSKLPNGAAILLNKILSCQEEGFQKAGLTKLFSAGVENEVLGDDIVKDFDVQKRKKLVKAEQLIQYKQQKNDQNHNYTIQQFTCHQDERQPINIFNQIESFKLLIQKEKETQIYKKFQKQIEFGFDSIFSSQDGTELEYIGQIRSRMQELQALEMIVQNANINEQNSIQQKTEAISNLYKNVTTQPSFEKLFFKFSEKEHQRYLDFINQYQLMYPPETSQFRHYSIISAGTQTPVHVLYDNPVSDYQELNYQPPKFIMADGDGLVPLHSSSINLFGKQFCGGSWVVPGIAHFPLVQNTFTMQIISQVVYDAQFQ